MMKISPGPQGEPVEIADAYRTYSAVLFRTTQVVESWSLRGMVKKEPTGQLNFETRLLRPELGCPSVGSRVRLSLPEDVAVDCICTEISSDETVTLTLESI